MLKMRMVLVLLQCSTVAMVTRRTRIIMKMTMVMVLLQDTRTLDPYSSYDFYQSQTTDFYERSGAGNDCRDQVSYFSISHYSPIDPPLPKQIYFYTL